MPHADSAVTSPAASQTRSRPRLEATDPAAGGTRMCTLSPADITRHLDGDVRDLVIATGARG
jgi:hypothetical protein